MRFRHVYSTGLDVIGMVKALKQRYIYEGKDYTLNKLRKHLPKKRSGNILGSIAVETKNGLAVKWSM